MHTWKITFLLLISSVLFSCTEEKDTGQPWHDITRSMRYVPDNGDFVIENGNRRFNRALYGSNTGFRVEAGDLPEFALYLPGMGGNLKFGIGTDEHNIWLIDAEQIIARYRPGSMVYEIRDPLLGKGKFNVHLLASSEGEGLILKINTVDIPGKVSLYWAFGGVSGKRFSRDGDIGADPESSFYLKPEYCRDNEFKINGNSFTVYFSSGIAGPEKGYDDKYITRSGEDIQYKKKITGMVPPGTDIRVTDANIQDSPGELYNTGKINEGVLSGKLPLSKEGEFYFMISVPGQTDDENKTKGLEYSTLSLIFENSEKARQELAGRIKINTPDPYINTLGPALSVAADAIWEEPTYLHGAVAWRNRLPGWRGAYAADWLGWHERARMHFDSYSKAQYTEPAGAPAAPDPNTNLSRQVEKAGYSLFTSGYISRNPDRISPPHHYDMNLVYIDQLLWHFNWTGDLEYARDIWPVLERHFEWERRCFDPEGDGLYNAYCCIWASDALQYSGGGVTHSSAYNYRGNLLAARLARMIGKDPLPYLEEAKKIRDAVQEQLWLPRRGWYAEHRDLLGKQLVHPSAGLWTIYHAFDAGLPDPFQAWQSLTYIDHEIPHIPIIADGMPEGNFYTLATSNWMPYTWSVNNVALAENLNTCLAYWQGGRKEEAFRLWKGQFLESMYNGASPGNFQQLSFYDAFRGELYRDFADPVGMAARTLVEGLFGIVPDALEKTLVIKPGFPAEWSSASIQTPDISYSFNRNSSTDQYTIIQDLPVDMKVCLRLEARGSKVGDVKVNGKETGWKIMEDAVGKPVIEISYGFEDTLEIIVEWKGDRIEEIKEPVKLTRGDFLEVNYKKAGIVEVYDPQEAADGETLAEHRISFVAAGLKGHRTLFVKVRQDEMLWWIPVNFEIIEPVDLMANNPEIENERTFSIKNNRKEKVEGKLKVNGKDYGNLEIPTGKSVGNLAVLAGDLVPGTNRFEIETGTSTISCNIVNWDIISGKDIRWETVDISEYFNDRVDNIFRNEYLSPRADVPTLQIPVQGIGDWCTYRRLPSIDDSGLRDRAGKEGRIILDQGIPLLTTGDQASPNIIYTSQWDNYPGSVSIPVTGKACHAYFMMTGSAHHMQSRMVNGIIRIIYSDKSCDSLALTHPDTWWPIEQDYYQDGFAFSIDTPRPPRIYLKSGEQQQEDYEVLTKNGTIDIEGGAATIYDLPLDPSKELEKIIFETIVNDVVMGLMSVTLIRE